MEEAGWLMISSILFLILLFLSKFIHKKQAKLKNLPPSPPYLPLIGHLHLFKEPLHRTLHNLANNYGHVIFLQLGVRNVLVVSSPSAVEECLSKNDIIFANRPQTLAGKHLNYNSTGVGFASYGDHWRNLRRITTLELLSNNRVTKFGKIREQEVQLLVKQLFEEFKGGHVAKKLELRPKLVDLSFNIMLRMISGKRYYGEVLVSQEGKEFQMLMKDFAEIHGCRNLNDFFPLLTWIDFQGVERRMKKMMSRMDKFLQNLLDKHRRKRNMSTAGNDQKNLTLIDVLLDLQETESEFYNNEIVKGIILAMLVAGSETTATTLEWALSLLLNHPKAMDKVRAEIDTNVRQDQLLNETDTSKLKYLQNVITETLRLYPVAPLLIPHESSNDCKVCGFDIPRGTMLLVNLWALHRDPKWWVDATRFVPERFEGGEGSCGEVYNLIPFGMGRRACPGAGLAKRVMMHALGAMIQCFEWDRIGNEKLDMTEGVGLTIPKLEPLIALCTPRQGKIKVLSNI